MVFAFQSIEVLFIVLAIYDYLEKYCVENRKCLDLVSYNCMNFKIMYTSQIYVTVCGVLYCY